MAPRMEIFDGFDDMKNSLPEVSEDFLAQVGSALGQPYEVELDI
jgi:hypothetical protein